MEIDGEHYQGKKISPAHLKLAGQSLPPIDSLSTLFMEDLKESYSFSVKLPESFIAYHSFSDPTSFYTADRESRKLLLKGNTVLFADELVISASSEINEAIIIARKVIIEEGFTGSMQLFCTDTVLVEKNVTLMYPSGIYVEAKIDSPVVSLSGNSEINGYVIILGRIQDEELLFPSYIQSETSILRGLLYVDGTTNIRGKIYGAIYVKDCFYTSNGNVYAGALHDTRVFRNNNIAYPIFLQGPYTRKEVKSIY